MASSDDEFGHPAADEHHQNDPNTGKRTRRRTSVDANAQHPVKNRKTKQDLQLVAEEDSDSDSEGLEASHSEIQFNIDEPDADDALGADGSGHVDLTGMPAFDEQDEPTTNSQISLPDETEPVQTLTDDPDTQPKRKRKDGHSRSFDIVEYEWDRFVSDAGSSASNRRPNQAPPSQQPNATKGKGKGRVQDAEDHEAPNKIKNKKHKSSTAPKTGMFITLYTEYPY